MGKNLIIKGADFSENALNELNVYKNIPSTGLSYRKYIVTSSVPTVNGFWGAGLVFDESLLNKVVNTVILNFVPAGGLHVRLDIPISIVLLTLGETPSVSDKILDVFLTNDDIIMGYKNVRIPSIIITSNQQTIAVGAWDKANVADDRYIGLPIGYIESGGPSIGVATNSTVADNTSWVGLPTIGYGYKD